MKRLLEGLLLACVLVTLTGCGGMVGHWQMDSIEPESARAEFAMSTLCLMKDGGFTACMDSGTTMTGTYDYDADADLITFKSDEGKQRTYKACVCGVTGNLLVESTQEDKVWKATMKRDKCACGAKCACGGKCSETCGKKCTRAEK